MIKYLTRATWGRKGWDLGSQPWEMACWQEPEAAGCPATVSKQKDEWDTLFSFSFFLPFHSGPQPVRWCYPHLKVGLPTSVNPG